MSSKRRPRRARQLLDSRRRWRSPAVTTILSCVARQWHKFTVRFLRSIAISTKRLDSDAHATFTCVDGRFVRVGSIWWLFGEWRPPDWRLAVWEGELNSG